MNHIRMLMCSLFFLSGVSGFALSELQIPNICYDTIDGDKFCTHDHLGEVQVLLYNAGWCPPCNEEMSVMPNAYTEFAESSVTFASLSGEGFSHGSKPDQTFLKEWKNKHQIPFLVAGKFRDFGQQFGALGFIPFSVVINQEGESVAHGNMEVSEITALVRNLLNNQTSKPMH